MKPAPIVILLLTINCYTSGALGAMASFDTFEEGFQGTVFVDGGITFFDADARAFSPPPSQFAIDDVSSLLPLLEDIAPFFSAPNVLGMFTFSIGPFAGASGRFGEFKMTTGNVENFASMEVFYFGDGFLAGNLIVLEAYRDGALVGTDSVEIFDIGRQHATLGVAGIEFDTLRLAGVGSIEEGVFFGSIDNVIISPEPGSLLLLSVVVVLASVRRSTSGARRRNGGASCPNPVLC